jgi:hypothetical protein
VSRNIFRSCKACLEAAGTLKYFFEIGKIKLQGKRDCRWMWAYCMIKLL